MPGLITPEAFRAWLYRIAHYKVARFVRHAILDRERVVPLVEESQDLAGAEPEATDAEAVHLALDQLDVLFREVLTLHYLRDLSLEEMAAVLDCPLGTVKSRLFHARAALRKIMKRNGYERDP